MKIYRSHSSFSLVEMVVVLGTFAILMSLILRGVTSTSEAARKAKAIGSLKAIAHAYRQYMEDNGHPIRWQELDAIKGTTGNEYDSTLIAAVLSRDGYLNAIEAWAWDFDYRIRKYLRDGGAMPAKICDIQRTGGKVTSAVINAGFRGRKEFPISVCAVVAANGCTNDDFFKNAGEIPVAYSRGLRDGTTNPGTWVESKVKFDLGGIFSDKGGFIAFLDGHVEWYANLGTGDRCALRKYGVHAVTNKIYEALPKGDIGGVPTNSFVLSWKGGNNDCGTF
jgi:type II secretory pathway pseudopilin PulG